MQFPIFVFRHCRMHTFFRSFLLAGAWALATSAHAQHAVWAEALDGEGAGHAHPLLVLVGLVVQVLALGLGRDRPGVGRR